MGDDPELLGFYGFNDSVGDSVRVNSTVDHWLNKFGESIGLFGSCTWLIAHRTRDLRLYPRWAEDRDTYFGLLHRKFVT